LVISSWLWNALGISSASLLCTRGFLRSQAVEPNNSFAVVSFPATLMKRMYQPRNKTRNEHEQSTVNDNLVLRDDLSLLLVKDVPREILVLQFAIFQASGHYPNPR